MDLPKHTFLRISRNYVLAVSIYDEEGKNKKWYNEVYEEDLLKSVKKLIKKEIISKIAEERRKAPPNQVTSFVDGVELPSGKILKPVRGELVIFTYEFLEKSTEFDLLIQRKEEKEIIMIDEDEEEEEEDEGENVKTKMNKVSLKYKRFLVFPYSLIIYAKKNKENIARYMDTSNE